MKIGPLSRRERSIKDVVVLKDVMRQLQCLVLTRPVAASDHRLAGVVVTAIVRLNRATGFAIRVRKGEIVRTPFNYQKKQERHREYAAELFFPTDLTGYVLHD